MERRLAAILAADIVGYSRLMRADEEGTLARLKALQKELFAPKVREHRGRIVKLMGDGALVEFASAVDAVRCAVAVQEGLAEREAGLAEDSALALRQGINLGDIIIDSGDIYGDGVKAALEQKPDLSLSYLKKTFPTKHPGGLDPYLDGLRKAGLPE